MNKPSVKVAFCGIIAAVSVIVMMLTGLVPIASIALPAIAGCLLIPVVAEFGAKWGFGVFAVCALVSLIMVPDREAMLFYILFFGYYPVLYAVLNRINSKVLRYIVKFVIFNAAFLLELWLSVKVLGIPFEEIEILGKFTLAVFLILGNLMFFIYDYAMNGLVLMYIRRFRDKIIKIFRK